MSILKSRIFRTLALLGCAAFCGVLIVGCSSTEETAPGSGGTAPASGAPPGGASSSGAAPGGAAPTSAGS